MITITTNAAAVARQFGGMAKQLPFAMALALTRTAQAAQAEVRSRLPESFEIRNDWISKGIRIKPARKTSLEASVFSKDYFLALHATGGDRVPASPGRDAVPVDARRRKRDFTRKASYPGKMLAVGGKGFKIKLPGGAIGIFKRRGRGKASKPYLYWVLKKSIAIKADWPLQAQIDEVVERVLPGAIGAGVEEALRTARPADHLIPR